MSKPTVISAEIMWAYLDKRNDMSGKYQVDLTHLSDAAVDALEQNGIKVLSKDDKGRCITCKSNNPIRAVNSAGDIIAGDIIGNGSKATAVVSYYDYDNAFGKGRSPSLMKLVITDLEVYENVEEVDVDLEAAL